MLKTLIPVEPELMTLCRSKTWVAAARRCQLHPQEAAPSQSAVNGTGTTALAIAVRSGAPIGVIQALVQANPSQLSIFHKFSGSILHEALKHKASPLILRYILNSTFQHVHPSFLARQNDLGRTALHFMVHAVLNDSQLWDLFQTIVVTCPLAVQVLDSDGFSPLVLTLQQRTSDNGIVYEMVKLMVTACPTAMLRTPNPLAYAILYGQSTATIQLLLEHSITTSSSTQLLTSCGETPLHLAATMNSSADTLNLLLETHPSSVFTEDAHNLTPLDWIWIRHVVTWCARAPIALTPSTRRYLSPHWNTWHVQTSREMMQSEHVELQQSLLERMRVCLPMAAVASATSFQTKSCDDWSLLHSACAVSCPLAMVRLTLTQDSKSLYTRDGMGRLPLHYAAARSGYKASIPVGVSREVRTLVEPSAVLTVACPRTVRVVDAHYQLPLHIAIDTAKQSGQQDEEDVVTELVRLHPNSLEQRDGVTMLYPFLQAASGESGSVQLIYSLLRPHPMLVSSGI